MITIKNVSEKLNGAMGERERAYLCLRSWLSVVVTHTRRLWHAHPFTEVNQTLLIINVAPWRRARELNGGRTWKKWESSGKNIRYWIFHATHSETLPRMRYREVAKLITQSYLFIDVIKVRRRGLVRKLSNRSIIHLGTGKGYREAFCRRFSSFRRAIHVNSNSSVNHWN